MMTIRATTQNNGFEDIKKVNIAKMFEHPASVATTQPAYEIIEDDISGNNTVTTTANFLRDDSLRFILVPLAVLLGIITLSALVYLMARQRRCSNRIGINFDNFTNHKADNYKRLSAGQECDEIDDDPTECLLNGKLQINNRYDTYQKAHAIRTSKNQSELYT